MSTKLINTGRWKRGCYQLGQALNIGSPILATIFGVIATLPVGPDFEAKNYILHYFYSFIREYLVFAFLLLLIGYILSIFLMRYGNLWILDKLQFVLDRYQGKAFVKKANPDPKDYHRVTLFQYKRGVLFPWHWSAQKTFAPWGGGKHPFRSNYLVPVLRSGRLSRKTNAIFHVSDSGDASEGIAGRAWVTEEAATAIGLPSIRSGANKRDIKVYAESTQSDEAMVEAMLEHKKSLSRDCPVPRSIVAIPVERFGKNWGVIVLDSRDPDGIASDAVENFKITIALIGQLLERI